MLIASVTAITAYLCCCFISGRGCNTQTLFVAEILRDKAQTILYCIQAKDNV
jgi:hypothetical protein